MTRASDTLQNPQNRFGHGATARQVGLDRRARRRLCNLPALLRSPASRWRRVASVLVVGVMMIVAGVAEVINAFQIKSWGSSCSGLCLACSTSSQAS